MDDHEYRALIAPLVKSRLWVLIVSGGLFLVGAGQFVGVIMVVVMIKTRDVAYFWKLLALPAGILAVLAGWQLAKMFRLLSMSSRSIQLSIVSEVSARARLALIFTGIMTLLFIFLTGGEVFWSAAIYGW
jgi:hypothetical protein